MNKKHRYLRALCEGAIMIAAAQILGYLRLFRLPNGGSITLGMLPIFLYCARWGFGKGMLTAFAYAVLQWLLDGGTGLSWQSMLGDYFAAYTVLGFAGVFYRLRGGFFVGTAVGGVLRFLVAWIVGATVWAEYMPERFFGMTMTSPWLYSALYNGSYILPCTVLCLVLGAICWKPLGKYFRGDDLR